MARALLMAVLLVLTALIPAAANPEAVAAACGTNWTSKKEPPESILVLRTGTGKVEKVSFKRYVVVVMASGEWPTTLPGAVLEAGGLATKQYGWYYTLKGNHRDGYKNASGRCYDVRDDSRDQVYSPETAEPTDKQKRARNALWGLSLRKNGKFFLTGYRRGEDVKCATDTDKWHLYARSAKDCAKRLGYDSEDILRAYYKPGVDAVWAPGTEPQPGNGSEPVDPEAEQAETATDTASSALDVVTAWFGGVFAGPPEETPPPA